MQREKVIELAKQIGGFIEIADAEEIDFYVRFAELVEADTIERCDSVCKAEAESFNSSYMGDEATGAYTCAAAIRSLK